MDLGEHQPLARDACERPDQPYPGQEGWPPVRSIDGHLARPRPPDQSYRTEPATASGYADRPHHGK